MHGVHCVSNTYLPKIDHQQQLLMQDFNNLKPAKDAAELKDRMQELARITGLWTKLADQSFDDHQKLAKLHTIIPTNLYTYIAISARAGKQYEWLVQMLEAQMMDRLTRLTRAERAPGPSGFDSIITIKKCEKLEKDRMLASVWR